MDVAQRILNYPINQTHEISLSNSRIFHILSGSFRSLSLFLLAFSPSNRSISHLQTIPAFGPHQYLAANVPKDKVYATSWAQPPSLSSWDVERPDRNPWRVTHINSVPITATSSYITIPPPGSHVYSVGGPTGESHLIDPSTGGFADKVQQLLFVPESELEVADKTRVALRYGSHGIEFIPSRKYAFVPVLATNTIEMYSNDYATGLLTHVTSVHSPRGEEAHDGPRHLKIHPNGKILYCVTEHSNYLDVYNILPTTLEYVSSRSLLPISLHHCNGSSSAKPNSEAHFRGDTLMLPPSSSSSPIPRILITTTRGSTSDLRGWLSIFPLDEEGYLSPLLSRNQSHPGNEDEEAERFETPTSGGKANAVDVIHKSVSGDPSHGFWILLTDDDDVTASSRSGAGSIRVLEWDGWGSGGVKIVAEWPAHNSTKEDDPDLIKGASHAIWLD